MLKIMGLFADWERDAIAERTETALEHKRRAYEKTGGLRPFGYNVVEGEKKKLEENQREQKVLQRIQELRENGLTLRAICRELRRRKIKTVSGSTEWKPTVVNRIFKRAQQHKEITHEQRPG